MDVGMLNGEEIQPVLQTEEEHSPGELLHDVTTNAGFNISLALKQNTKTGKREW